MECVQREPSPGKAVAGGDPGPTAEDPRGCSTAGRAAPQVRRNLGGFSDQSAAAGAHITDFFARV